MAFALGPQNNGRRRRGRRGASGGTMSEMNVVPLVDIVLVLLIIFMVTAHAMNSALKIEAPAVKQTNDTAEDLPQVAMTRDGHLFLNADPVPNINLLAADINKRFNNPKAVYLLADGHLIWQDIASVVAELGAAHFDVKVVTKPQDMAKKP